MGERDEEMRGLRSCGFGSRVVSATGASALLVVFDVRMRLCEEILVELDGRPCEFHRHPS
jgi:hypothetical protein